MHMWAEDGAPPHDLYWLKIDSAPGGCDGADRIIIGQSSEPGNKGAADIGDVIATPTCDPATWHWLDVAGTQKWNGEWYEFDFRESVLHGASTIKYQAWIRLHGQATATADQIPNGAPATFSF